MVIELAQTTWDNIVKILTGSKVETLLKTTSGINSVYSGKMYPVDLSEHYSDDGETLLSKDVMGGFYEF